MKTFGILVGGGPAPGINGVIEAATGLARRNGARVIGILEGFRWLMEGVTRNVVELDAENVATIHFQGGSIIKTSRSNPTRSERDLVTVVDALVELEIDYLITIGGDDTAFSARRVSEIAGKRIRVAHVPKTIDNDLPLPGQIPTFGFESARDRASQIVAALLADARTAGRWYFVVIMGRKAGHLAEGAGKSAGANVVVIPEEFSERPVSLDRVARVLEGAIIKGDVLSRPYGVAVIAEGIGEIINPSDFSEHGSFEHDDHGHIRLAEVPLGRVLRDTVRDALRGRGVSVSIINKDVGYELRCVPPNAFDLSYTRDLGCGAVRALLRGESEVMVTLQEGALVTIPLESLADEETNRTRVRLVDVSQDSHAYARDLQQRIELNDFESPEREAALAKAARLSIQAFRDRFRGEV